MKIKDGSAILKDSLWSLNIGGKTQEWKVTKKVSNTYFVATDGIKDYIYKITVLDKISRGVGYKYNGIINVESGNLAFAYFFLKEEPKEEIKK